MMYDTCSHPRLLALTVAAALLLGATTGAAQISVSPNRTKSPATVSTSAMGTVTGSAWKGDTLPYPAARLRLRNVQTGSAGWRTESDSDGKFKFEHVSPGPYVVELLSPQDQVLSIGDLFSVQAGEQASTLVRLSSRSPWFGGFFSNAATAVISAASTLGVSALGSSGRPASAQ